MSRAEVGIHALIVNYRRGPKTQKNNELVIEIPNVKDRSKAASFIGRKVVLMLGKDNGKIMGKITSTHGNSGKLIARFRRGIPGQALGRPIIIL